MSSLILISSNLVFLLGTTLLTIVNSAVRRMHHLDYSMEGFEHRFFYRSLHNKLFPEHEYEGLLIATISAQNITRFGFAITAILLAIGFLPSYALAITLLLFIFFGFLFGDLFARVIGVKFPDDSVKYCAPLASFFMLLALPITWVAIRLFHSQFRSVSFEEPLSETKLEIIEIIQKSSLSHELTIHEKQLIESVLTFKDRIAREVMVPRVDVFSLSADTPIREAAKLIQEEGYSRIPVYKNNVDNIVGVLMYKDVLDKYSEFAESGCNQEILDAPIETLQKTLLYTPETKKISNLLLEFRKKQMHLAIVVDEYGGTEGIVTIEDILEEIVGEIADEYDEEEEPFQAQPDGSWVVDARMSLLDVEEQLGVKIPQEGDYETIGGFIFDCTGSIPKKGFVIHQEEFQIEVLRSDERRVEKVRIKLIPKD